jgi:pyridoxine 4-dehydrogenase
VAESVGALAELRDEGKISLIGVSNVSLAQLDEALAIAPVAAVQNRYSAARGGDDEVLARTIERSIAFVPWGPLRDQTSATAQQALVTLLRRALNILPIPGTTSVAHLEENMTAASESID